MMEILHKDSNIYHITIFSTSSSDGEKGHFWCSVNLNDIYPEVKLKVYLVSFLIPPASQKLCNNLDGFLPPEIKLAKWLYWQ